jgi:hypothetical protein
MAVNPSFRRAEQLRDFPRREHPLGRCSDWGGGSVRTQLEWNPEAMNPDPLPGYVWLDTPGKVLHVEVARLEFRNDPPA